MIMIQRLWLRFFGFASSFNRGLHLAFRADGDTRKAFFLRSVSKPNGLSGDFASSIILGFAVSEKKNLHLL
jgi:hypothetical protein